MSFNRFANNALWNLAGQIAPIAIALIALPPLIHALGMDRYGFLTLAWALVGYAGLFDLGLSRAMTRLVAQRLATQDRQGALQVGAVATTLMLAFGVFSGALLGTAATAIVDGWLKVPPALRNEAINAMWLLAAAMPVVLITSAYRGTIEAHQCFKALSVVRIVMGVFTFAGPLCAAWLSPRLEVTVGAVVAMRVVAAWAHAWLADRQCGFRYRFTLPDRVTTRHLFALGGWMSVSNIVGPFMSNMDRFILGGLVAVEMVAYYATPYDLIGRTMVLPYAVMGVLFPMIAGLANDARRARETYDATIRMLFVCMFPVVFVAFTLGGSFLRIWLGENFAQHGTIVLQLLCIGVLANTLAQAPANMVQALGQPKWMAVTHLLELPFFLLAIWYFTLHFGIAGTALAWTLRTIVDCVIMFMLVSRNLGGSDLAASRALLAACFAAALCWAGYAAATDLQRVTVCALGLGAFSVFAWSVVLTGPDKARILRYAARAHRTAS